MGDIRTNGGRFQEQKSRPSRSKDASAKRGDSQDATVELTLRTKQTYITWTALGAIAVYLSRV